MTFLNPRSNAAAKTKNAETALRHIVLAGGLPKHRGCFDDDRVEERVAALVPRVKAAVVAALAIEAREHMRLRYIPLLLVREMARHASHRPLVAATLARVIQRADDLTEFVVIYWKDGKQPLSAQVKKGLAAAFVKFDAYQFAKYDRAASVHLRDVLFLCHARPLDLIHEVLWEQLANGTLGALDASACVRQKKAKAKSLSIGQAL